MLKITVRQDCVEIPLKVSPGAAQNKIQGLWGEALKISVTAAPEKGKANKEIIRLLAKIFKVSKTDIDIIQGKTSSQKVVAVYQCSEQQVLQELAQYL